MIPTLNFLKMDCRKNWGIDPELFHCLLQKVNTACLWAQNVFATIEIILHVYLIVKKCKKLKFHHPAVIYAAAEHQGCLFWITCKRLNLLRKASCLQLIQNLAPSVVWCVNVTSEWLFELPAIWVAKPIQPILQHFFPFLGLTPQKN